MSNTRKKRVKNLENDNASTVDPELMPVEKSKPPVIDLNSLASLKNLPFSVVSRINNRIQRKEVAAENTVEAWEKILKKI